MVIYGGSVCIKTLRFLSSVTICLKVRENVSTSQKSYLVVPINIMKPGDLVWYHNWHIGKPVPVMFLYVERKEIVPAANHIRILYQDQEGIVLQKHLSVNKNGCIIDRMLFSNSNIAYF